jgi:hypothetical protein
MVRREHQNQQGVIMWERGTIVCTALVLAPKSIDITLTLNGITVLSASFRDSRAAADFAIERMRDYYGD